MSIRLIALLFVLSSVVTTSTVKAIELVDVELQLLIDISGSILVKSEIKVRKYSLGTISSSLGEFWISVEF